MSDTLATNPESAEGQVPSLDAAKVERAYLQLKQAILSGEYHPNERLVEMPLTRKLGISRNTLRTVIARLKHDGLIEVERNRGSRVRSFTLKEAYNILRVRQVLEGLVARLAAENSTAEQRDRLRAVQRRMEQNFRDNDLVQFSAGCREFHIIIEQASDNPNAMDVLESLHYPLVKFQFQLILVPGRMEETLDEHERILMAIEVGDAEKAQQLGYDHMDRLGAMLMQPANAESIPVGL